MILAFANFSVEFCSLFQPFLAFWASGAERERVLQCGGQFGPFQAQQTCRQVTLVKMVASFGARIEQPTLSNESIDKVLSA